MSDEGGPHSRANVAIRTRVTGGSIKSMPDKVRIALDAMGGDNGPAVVVEGAEVALQHHPECEFIFFGDAAQIAPLIDARPLLKATSTTSSGRSAAPGSAWHPFAPQRRCAGAARRP